MTEKIIILGSTGSIGTQALDVCRMHGIKVGAISGGKQIDVLENQIREFKPKICGVADDEAGKLLKIAVADTDTEIITGKDSAALVAQEGEGDTVLNSVSGIAGLNPTLSAIRSGKKRLALANKESLVTAGKIVKDEIEKHKTELIPVDSEHSAIFQCLDGKKAKKLILTASGGPFYGYTGKQLEGITPQMALAHPTWNMGNRITIDSSTMMNKGFEVIEAAWLFDTNPKDIDVCVHRQSIVHSMVEFEDGAVIAQMGRPDMRVCIQYAMTYPNRIKSPVKPIDFTTLGQISFDKPDDDNFPLLPFARKVFEMGGVYGAVLNGADEEAVSLFLNGKIKYTDISKLIIETVNSYRFVECDSIENVFEADRFSREYVRKLIER